MSDIAQLEDELALRKLEAQLVKAKGTKAGASLALKLKVRQARQAYRTKYPAGGTVNPGTIDTGVG